MLAPLALDAPEIDTLEACALRGPHPRIRHRPFWPTTGACASTSWLRPLVPSATPSAAGFPAGNDLGLAEGRRAGRPPKLPEAAQKNSRLARRGHPTTAPLRAAPGRRVRPARVGAHVAAAGAGPGLRLEALPAQPQGPARPDAFAAMRTHLRGLHAAGARGECAVVYADECRFSRQATVPYALYNCTAFR